MPPCHASNILRPHRIVLLCLLACCTVLFLSGCQEQSAPSRESATADTYFPIRLGDSTLQLQLALTPFERGKGLMFRDAMGEHQGMLFLFEQAERRGFWMKNTSIPLDLGYFDASGRLQEVHPLYPFDETPVASKSDQIVIAVETNQGWYAANQITAGARLDLDALKAAVSRRGLNLATFAIED
ncbi:MAG: DUF192 domain-containing protein [Opitutales bacterium]